MSISIGLYPILDLWTANKLHYITLCHIFSNIYILACIYSFTVSLGTVVVVVVVVLVVGAEEEETE